MAAANPWSPFSTQPRPTEPIADVESQLSPPAPAHLLQSSPSSRPMSATPTAHSTRPPSLAASTSHLNAEKQSEHDHDHPDDETVVDPLEAAEEEKGKRIPSDNEFLVSWDGADDAENPQNWKRSYRWYLTIMANMLVLNATLASSAPASLVPEMTAYFGVSREVGTLLISLFVAGYCVGPLIWGPASESFGRRIVFIVSYVFYVGFTIGCALSKNTASILVFRFLSGCFAASPLTNSGVLMADIWPIRERGIAMATFTVAPFAGPALAPLIGGFIAVRGVSWRWIYWVLTIFSGVMLALIVFTIPETHAPTILRYKAERKRKETGDSRWYAPIERVKMSASQRASNIVAKPFKILFQEPVLMAITLYMAFIYGCLYLLFEAYPIVFTQGHGFNAGISGLMFLPLLFGACTTCLLIIYYYNPKYSKLVDECAPNPPAPEARLPMAAVGGVLFALSFFWFGWTSYPSISFWAPMLAGYPLGMGLTMLFLPLFNYILDAYLAIGASALAATTVVRSAFGAGFPLFATQMFETLNPRWASTLLGCLAVLMMPMPFLFIRFGPTLRARSKFSAKDLPGRPKA